MTEQDIQQACVRWFRYQHPSKILFGVNNNARGIKISAKRAAGIAKSMGVLAGVSDLVLCYRGVTTFIELKAPKKYQQPSQKQFEQKAESSGFEYYVVKSFDEFKQLIEDIL